MTTAIIAAEVAFWLALLGGLALRYLVRATRLSSIVLTCVPLVDLALVTFVAVDLARGAVPSLSHGVAAVYLGFTVAFGHTTIRWADGWFKYRLGGGPRPTKPPKGSRQAVRALWVEWFRVVLAAVVALIGIGVMMLAGEHGVSNHPLLPLTRTIAMVVCIWFVAGPAFAGRGDTAKDRTR